MANQYHYMAVMKNNNEMFLSFSKYFCTMPYTVPADTELWQKRFKKQKKKKTGKKTTPHLFFLSGTTVWQQN